MLQIRTNFYVRMRYYFFLSSWPCNTKRALYLSLYAFAFLIGIVIWHPAMLATGVVHRKCGATVVNTTVHAYML